MAKGRKSPGCSSLADTFFKTRAANVSPWHMGVDDRRDGEDRLGPVLSPAPSRSWPRGEGEVVRGWRDPRDRRGTGSIAFFRAGCGSEFLLPFLNFTHYKRLHTAPTSGYATKMDGAHGRSAYCFRAASTPGLAATARPAFVRRSHGSFILSPPHACKTGGEAIPRGVRAHKGGC